MHGRSSCRRATIRYRDSGADRRSSSSTALLVDSQLWDGVLEELHGEFRCIAPDLPLGSHRSRMAADADLTPPASRGWSPSFLEALDLHDVTLVANDTGGALCQLVVIDRGPSASAGSC